MPRARRDRTVTELGRRLEKALTALNDQYCFFLFLESEFLEQLRTRNPAELDRYTTEIFPGNPYSARIRVPLQRLPQFQQAHRGATFSAYFSSSYEVASAFFDGALELLRTNNASSLRIPRPRNEGPEQYYWRLLLASNYATPSSEIIDTLTFFRYRRNAVVHLLTTPPRPYVNLAQQRGIALNAFWTIAKVQIDFQHATVDSLNEDDTRDAIKLLRIIVQRLDAHLGNVLDPVGAARVEATRLYGSKRARLNQLVIEQRSRKLRGVLLRKLGVKVSDGVLAAAIRAANP